MGPTYPDRQVNMNRFEAMATLALALLLCSPLGCTQVEDRDGGLLTPFPDGVSGGDAADLDGGGMDLPPASDFVKDDAPIVVDTGGPPAVVVADDDSAEDPEDALAEAIEVEPIRPPEPATPEPATPAPLPVEPPTPAAVQPVVAETSAPPRAALATAPTLPAHCETALLMSAPLSEVALIATIPDAAPPRAIVRFPSGEERVVQVGDLLGDSGSKVILITAGSVKLAEVVVNEPDRPAIVTHYLHQSR